MKRFAFVLASALGVSAALAQQLTVEPGIAGYQKTSGVSGNINSIGSDTMNNLMALWGEAFQKTYPNAQIQIEGKGSSTGAAGAHRRYRAVRTDVASDARDRNRSVRVEIRLQADGDRHRLRRARDLRQQGQSAREDHHGAGRRCLLQDTAARRQEHRDVGRPRAHRRLGGAAALALRPQLGVGNLRLLQGAHAEERGLPRSGQGAARLGVRGAGRYRGSVRHRLQRDRIPHVGGENRGARGDGRVLGRELRRREIGDLSAFPVTCTST